nr:hypothetical protein [uncultured Flavobacterium sp.]
MSITLKNIVDDVKNLASKFQVTDESRLNNDWLPLKINEVRGQLIVKQYGDTDIIDPAWLTDLSAVQFHKVNISDDVNVSWCNDCPVSKAYIPQVINLPTKSPNQDLGIQMIISLCGKNNYSYRSLAQWRLIPSSHPYSKYPIYSRINTALYVNRNVEQLRVVGILADPSDGYYIQSEPIASGSIVSGTSYIVKFGSVTYNSATYSANDTFTGTSWTTYTGSGKVYLEDQAVAYRDTYPYPVSADMARQITLEILSKEFQVEKGLIVDTRNDSKDDAQKS